MRNAATGLLEFLEAHNDGANGIESLGGATAVAVSPDGTRVYVASYDDDALVVFTRDPVSGHLTFLQALLDGVDGVEGLRGARDGAVSPDGTHVYVAALSDDAVTAFARDSGTGTLHFVAAYQDGVASTLLDGAWSVAVSPDGAYVYVAAYRDQAVVQFKRNAATGTTISWPAISSAGINWDPMNPVPPVTAIFNFPLPASLRWFQ